ncbi:MAG: HRDC domain-containing protein [Armatimonadetes bacterium]|nr:HRDC domain-containing protein [Akkermansiaceae bacterium]
MISSSSQLQTFLSGCDNKDGIKVCAIDTEADSLHRYRESLCLIQFTAGHDCVLIDPLAIDSLKPLGTYLKDATVWMHGADYDMTMLKREFGNLPETVYDTQIGARLLGVKKFGLGDLVEHYFNIILLKSSQKADWGKRPLSEKMIDYALNDVRYLLEMGDIIVARLKEKGRYEWFTESCEAALRKVADRDDCKDDQWRISGSGKLDPYGLACLRALWNWRDKEAESWDRPSFMVAPNRQLIEWSISLADKKKIDLPSHFRSDRVKRFKEILAELHTLPQADWPERPISTRRKRDRDFDQRVDATIAKRNKIALGLDLDGSLIASRAVLESIAANESQPDEVLMKWQLALLDL